MKDKEKDENYNQHFSDHSKTFRDLTIKEVIDTNEDIVVTCIIDEYSTRAVVLLKVSDEELRVNQYELSSKKLLSSIEIKGEYIKANIIQQNSAGDQFLIAYIDNGVFHLLVIDYDKILIDFNVNEHFNIDNHTIPIAGIFNPFAITTYMEDENVVFYCFYHRKTKMNYHFTFNIKENKVNSELHKSQAPGTNKNFPQQCFLNTENNQINCFFRQGLALDIEMDDLSKHRYQNISDRDMGQMILWNSECLITRSSTVVQFYKQVWDAKEKYYEWDCVSEIESTGFISSNRKGNNFYITEDEFIYFYTIDGDTLKPTLQNVMFNFMQCSILIIGEQGRFALTYKANQSNLLKFEKKMDHDFCVRVNDEDFENSSGLNMIDNDCVIICKPKGEILIVDQNTYKLNNKIQLPLEKSDSREEIEVLSVAVSHDSQFIAIFAGKQLIKDEELIDCLYILEKSMQDEIIDYKIIKTVDMVTIGLTDVCKKFYFDHKKTDELLMVSNSKVFKFNFKTHLLETIYDFHNDLKDQPEFFIFNEEQDTCVIASASDGLMIDIRQHEEIDLDSFYSISDIKKVIGVKDKFYIMANKRFTKLGYYVLVIDINDPIGNVTNPEEVEKQFLINASNKLDIGNVDMYSLQDKTRNQLVISYKSIYVNVYNIFIIDIETGNVDYKYESFCLWENNIHSFFNTVSEELVTLRQEGMFVTSLKLNLKDRILNDNNDIDLRCHNMIACNYLKIAPENNILFKCTDPNHKILHIQS